MGSPAPLGRLRLIAQRLVGDPCATAAEAAGWMTCVQGQQLPAARSAVAMRTRGGSLDDVDSALASGQVVRSWPMRGTLHLVPARDLSWMLNITEPLMTRSAAKRWTDLGLTVADQDRDEQVTRSLLAGGRALSRRVLVDAWAESGVDTAGQAAAHRLLRLAIRGVICLGPMLGRQQAFVLSDEWIASPVKSEHDAAIVCWAIRYFRSHGPATRKDFLWWTGLRLKDVQPVWDEVTDQLEHLVADGTDYYLDPLTLDRYDALRRATTAPLLTVAFDEILLGYTDRSAVLDPKHFEAVVPGRNGMFLPVVIDGGRAVGTWSRTRHTDVTVTPFDGAVSAKVSRALPRMARNVPR